MNCIDFFTTHSTNPDKCKELLKFQSQLANWESEKASAHSPGVVENHELIFRQIQDPRNLNDEKNAILPNCMDDISNKGLSCHRIAHTTLKRITKIAEDRAAKSTSPRRFVGFIQFSVDRVRQIFVTDGRPFFVFDTALESDTSHCDICQIPIGSKLERRELREELFKLSKNNISLRNGT